MKYTRILLFFTIAVLLTISTVTAKTIPVNDTLNWSGQTWGVRNERATNADIYHIWNWSSSGNNIWVDDENKLHMTIKRDNRSWNQSHIYSKRQFKYGTFSCKIKSPVLLLDKNVVCAFFTHDDYFNKSVCDKSKNQVDDEFTKLDENEPDYMPLAWYMVQSDSVHGNKIKTPVILLNKNVVFTGLIYADYYDTSPPNKYENEIDIEFAKWGEDEQYMAWYTVQPDHVPGNQFVDFHSGDNEYNGIDMTVKLDWQPDYIRFKSTKPDGMVLNNFTYTNLCGIPDNYTEIMFELWLFNNMPPSDGKDVEVVFSNFNYTPASRVPEETGSNEVKTNLIAQ